MGLTRMGSGFILGAFTLLPPPPKGYSLMDCPPIAHNPTQHNSFTCILFCLFSPLPFVLHGDVLETV